MVIIHEDNITVPQDYLMPGKHKVMYLDPCCVKELVTLPLFHLFMAASPMFRNAGETTYVGVYAVHVPTPARVRQVSLPTLPQ